MQAPPEVGRHDSAQLPYAAPYIPEPSLPPPEYPHILSSPRHWQPGRKAALLIGVNYTQALDQNARLKGSVNDIQCLQHLLIKRFGWVLHLEARRSGRRCLAYPCLMKHLMDVAGEKR